MHHVVVQAHCYQPPRENPWLEVVEAEPSAAPDHDWNARIDRECYARLAQAEVRQRDDRHRHDPDAREGLARLINLYAWCTFDVGATLCEWLEKDSPATLQAMIDGDAASMARWGHGNAIAAPYHHIIVPLASLRDRRTEVRWGITDFRRRFGREPEGMWLPECAADDETLDLLAAEGIRFTILAPYQVQTDGETHGLPVRWNGSKGRSLMILPYDGALAGDVAFGGLLQNADALARRLAPQLNDGQQRCTTLATDGETFGHHHRGGDRVLATAMAAIARRTDARLINAAALVAAVPPTRTATLVSPSSWSCSHGIERWRANCGCRINHTVAPDQHWRGPLRDALQWLAQHSDDIFEHEGAALFRGDVWDVRSAYGDVVATDGAALRQFVRDHLAAPLDTNAELRAQTLLEMQRATLRMFTSCAWFFDEVDRIETRQVLRYASRVLELSGQQSALAPEFMTRLAHARAAHPPSPTARDAFLLSTSSEMHNAERVAAGAVALAAAGDAVVVTPTTLHTRIAVYDVLVELPDDTRSPPTWPEHTSGPDWAVTITHRRTGTIYAWRGRAVGAGPSLTVLLAPHSEPQKHRSPPPILELGMADFPESVARRLLQQWTTDDAALTG